MEPALPLKSVVLFIACGGMVFIIVFIFAKRQITRFALKSRGPHVAIGSDAPKDLRQEIERRLHRVGDITFEPKLLPDSLQTTLPQEADQLHFYYRMKAIDALVILDEELLKYSQNIRRRLGQHSLRSFLLDLRQSGPLVGCKIDWIEKFTESYVHARHDPIEFLEPQYNEFMTLLNQLCEHIRGQKAKKAPSAKTTHQTISSAPAIKKSDSASSDKDTKKSTSPGTDVQKIEVPVMYRPHSKEPLAGAVPMVAAAGSSGSSQVDQGSTEAQSVASSVRSSRSSSHFETVV